MNRLQAVPLLVLVSGIYGTLSAQTNNSAKLSDSIMPKVACTAMAGRMIPASVINLPTNGATLKSAKLDPGTGQIAIPADYIPEHCYIQGAIKPVDSAAPDINFAIAIPTAWDQKAWGIAGNGGDGFIPLLVTLARGLPGSPVGATFPPDSPFPITKGDATYGDDTGHVGGGIPWLQRLTGGPLPPADADTHLPGPPGPDPQAWMRNDEAYRNYAGEHIKKTYDVVMEVFQEMYGIKPKFNYYGGESQGGRSASMAMTRYPQDYDGIVLSVPILYFSVRDLSRELHQKMQMAPGAWIPPAKEHAIRMETVRLCDSLDGLADGVINNYLACNRRLDPRVNPDPLANIRCPGGADTGNDCLSDAQMAVINAFHTPIELGFPLANGETFIAPIPVSQESAGGYGGHWLELSEKKPGGKALPASILAQHFGNPEKYDLLKHDVGDFREDLQAVSKLLDSSSDWSGLLAGKTKVILHAAAADYRTYAWQIEWYDDAVKRHGQAAIDKSVRFYVTPNGDHQSIGFSATTGVAQPRYMDLMGTLENWVENDVTPPDALKQTLEEPTPPYKVLRSRPLCRYPKYPRYKGKGDPEKMESYTCAMP